MRFINLFAFALMSLALVGAFLSTGRVASADVFGTDCNQSYTQRKIPQVYCPSTDDGTSEIDPIDTFTTSCATSPTGLCCTYKNFNVYCKQGHAFWG